MNDMTNSAWNMHASDKTDVLIEPEHTHLILKFCNDKQTTPEIEDSTLILYGPDQGVLISEVHYPTTKLMLLYYVLISSVRLTLSKIQPQ